MDRRGRRSLRFLEKFEHLRAIFLFYKHTDKSKFEMQKLTIGVLLCDAKNPKSLPLWGRWHELMRVTDEVIAVCAV